jgi:predicted RNase H-like HicB family nuclease
MRIHVHGHLVELHPLTDGGWQAIVPDLPGCLAEGDTMHEAVAAVARVVAAWLEVGDKPGRLVTGAPL